MQKERKSAPLQESSWLNTRAKEFAAHLPNNSPDSHPDMEVSLRMLVSFTIPYALSSVSRLYILMEDVLALRSLPYHRACSRQSSGHSICHTYDTAFPHQVSSPSQREDPTRLLADGKSRHRLVRDYTDGGHHYVQGLQQREDSHIACFPGRKCNGAACSSDVARKVQVAVLQ